MCSLSAACKAYSYVLFFSKDGISLWKRGVMCSFTKLTVPKHVFSGGWWLMAFECLWSVSSTMSIPKIDRISSEYWVQRVPLLLFLSFSPLFTHSPHSLQREFILLACSVNEWSAEKPLSMVEKGSTHIHQLSHYITAYRTESRKWITAFKKEETGLINTPTFMQSKIRALPQHAVETATKCCKICRHK